ncbi:MAG: acetyl-CoA carboxylase biotin carboxyl carrier protein subunit, partial [Actinobacteria bacterium]|nr:acetyl-CoA carboxylase biotin carboxyl carrier protein subunit [Actinomycetota bacterium]
LEAMKMEHRITAAIDGTVEAVLVSVGQSVDAHQPLVTLAAQVDPDGPASAAIQTTQRTTRQLDNE